MGDRSLIVITNNTDENLLVMYGHWSGGDNLQAVHNVIEKTGRIGDNYIVAEVFHEFSVVLGGYSGIGSGSFGMWADRLDTFDEGWIDSPTVYLNADTGDYTCDGVDYSKPIPEPPKADKPEQDVVYGGEA
jgi:hypothetical protein